MGSEFVPQKFTHQKGTVEMEKPVRGGAGGVWLGYWFLRDILGRNSAVLTRAQDTPKRELLYIKKEQGKRGGEGRARGWFRQ